MRVRCTLAQLCRSRRCSAGLAVSGCEAAITNTISSEHSAFRIRETDLDHRYERRNRPSSIIQEASTRSNTSLVRDVSQDPVGGRKCFSVVAARKGLGFESPPVAY